MDRSGTTPADSGCNNSAQQDPHVADAINYRIKGWANITVEKSHNKTHYPHNTGAPRGQFLNPASMAFKRFI